MRRFVYGITLFGLFAFAACGSSDDGGGTKAGTGGSGGGGTTCANGYPKLGAACAIANEKCASCGTGWPCCDYIECKSGAWVLTQSHTACPADAAPDTTSDTGPDSSDDGTAEADVPDADPDADPDASADAATD